MYSEVNQLYAHMYIYMDIYVLFLILFHYGFFQKIEYSSLCYTVGPAGYLFFKILFC